MGEECSIGLLLAEQWQQFNNCQLYLSHSTHLLYSVTPVTRYWSVRSYTQNDIGVNFLKNGRLIWRVWCASQWNIQDGIFFLAMPFVSVYIICMSAFINVFNSLFARGSNFSEPVLQHLVNTCCKPYLLYGCEVIIWTKSELSNISYAFNSVLCRIYRVKHNLLSCICKYTGQSDILDEISNRH